MYFLKRFYTLIPVRIVLITRPLLPIEPEIPPRSSKKKFITCSGCRSSCLHKDIKFMIAVFLVPIFSTFGGLSMILVFYARSGLFFSSVTIILCSNFLYRFSLRSTASLTLFYYSLALSFS